jgi:hypothetical protein
MSLRAELALAIGSNVAVIACGVLGVAISIALS